jgi:hypothetical protein
MSTFSNWDWNGPGVNTGDLTIFYQRLRELWGKFVDFEREYKLFASDTERKLKGVDDLSDQLKKAMDELDKAFEDAKDFINSVNENLNFNANDGGIEIPSLRTNEWYDSEGNLVIQVIKDNVYALKEWVFEALDTFVQRINCVGSLDWRQVGSTEGTDPNLPDNWGIHQKSTCHYVSFVGHEGKVRQAYILAVIKHDHPDFASGDIAAGTIYFTVRDTTKISAVIDVVATWEDNKLTPHGSLKVTYVYGDQIRKDQGISFEGIEFGITSGTDPNGKDVWYVYCKPEVGMAMNEAHSWWVGRGLSRWVLGSNFSYNPFCMLISEPGATMDGQCHGNLLTGVGTTDLNVSNEAHIHGKFTVGWEDNNPLFEVCDLEEVAAFNVPVAFNAGIEFPIDASMTFGEVFATRLQVGTGTSIIESDFISSPVIKATEEIITPVVMDIKNRPMLQQVDDTTILGDTDTHLQLQSKGRIHAGGETVAYVSDVAQTTGGVRFVMAIWAFYHTDNMSFEPSTTFTQVGNNAVSIDDILLVGRGDEQPKAYKRITTGWTEIDVGFTWNPSVSPAPTFQWFGLAEIHTGDWELANIFWNPNSNENRWSVGSLGKIAAPQVWFNTPEEIGIFSVPPIFQQVGNIPPPGVLEERIVYRQVIPLSFVSMPGLPVGTIDAMQAIDVEIHKFDAWVFASKIPRMILKADVCVWAPNVTTGVITYELGVSSSNVISVGGFNLAGQFYLRWNRRSNGTDKVVSADHMETTYLRWKGVIENQQVLTALRNARGYITLEFVT